MNGDAGSCSYRGDGSDLVSTGLNASQSGDLDARQRRFRRPHQPELAEQGGYG